jgi:hypothetical protein
MMNIKTPLQFSAALLAAALFAGAGCAQGEPLITLPAVGPESGPAFSATGYLVVYTDTESPINTGDIQYYPHTGYTIYDSHGAKYRSVRNHLGERDENPMRVSLPPGHYTVVGKSETKGEVAVPITISALRTTVVNLEKRARRNEFLARPPPSLACLPVGRPEFRRRDVGERTEGRVRHFGRNIDRVGAVGLSEDIGAQHRQFVHAFHVGLEVGKDGHISSLLVVFDRILIQRAVQRAEVIENFGRLGALAGAQHVRRPDRREQGDNGDDNHDFHERKPLAEMASGLHKL